MSSSATGVGMTICFLGAILLILTQKSSQKFGDVLGIGKMPNSFLKHLEKYYFLGKRCTSVEKIIKYTVALRVSNLIFIYLQLLS